MTLMQRLSRPVLNTIDLFNALFVIAALQHATPWWVVVPLALLIEGVSQRAERKYGWRR